MLLIGKEYNLSGEVKEFIEKRLKKYTQRNGKSYYIADYQDRDGIESVKLFYNGKKYFVKYYHLNDLKFPIFREIYSCESCGKDIKRGYGKVCRACEKRLKKN